MIRFTISRIYPFQASSDCFSRTEKSPKIMVRAKRKWVNPWTLNSPHDVSDEFCFLYVGQSFDFDTDDLFFHYHTNYRTAGNTL